MHRFTITLNPKTVEHPVIEVSADFEDQLMYLLDESTQLGIDVLRAEKEFYHSDGYDMVKYTFGDLSEESKAEFDWFAKKLAIYFNHVVNGNLN